VVVPYVFQEVDGRVIGDCCGLKLIGGRVIGVQVLGVQEIGGRVIGVYEPYPPKETGTVATGDNGIAVIMGTGIVVVVLGKFDAVSHLNESAHFSLLIPDVL
jgi:hypothetical protein